MTKNSRRKTRRFEQKNNDITFAERFELVRKVAEKWGKELQICRTCDPTKGSNGAERYTIHVAFGDIPYVVLGSKGVGRTVDAADSNCAWNLVSFFQEYLSRPSLAVLRTKWASAESEIEEVVNVCRKIEETLNSEEFCQLKAVSVLDINPPEKAWARQLRLEIRKTFAGQKLLNSFTKSKLLAVNSTVFTQQSQSGLTSKRRLSVDVIRDGDHNEAVPAKKSKACQAEPSTNGHMELNADEYDEDGLHFTYISPLTSSSSSSSVVCLDDDECEEAVMHPLKIESAEPTLNIASTPLSPSDSASSSRSLHHDFPLTGPGHLSFAEENLIGVHFNPSAFSIHDRVCQYREKYPKEFKILDADIWRHYQCNRQTEEVYEWKMEVRNILLAEFRPAFPRQHIELFAVGSTVNGCGSYNSDMDLCLCVPTGMELLYSSERIAAIKILRRLNTMIRGKPSLRKVVRKSEVIPAKVPIIKMALHPPYEELDLDINVNNTAGIYNSHLIHYYSLIDQRFPAVCLLVKHWAITNGIADAATGTFNSYSLILLVLHFFQCGVHPAVLPNLQHLYPEKFGSTPPLTELHLFQPLDCLPPRSINKQTVGELLVGFFYYYASFDYENYAISMRNARTFPRSQLPPDTFIYQVFIEEPFDRNNTARCVTKPFVMDRIKRAFRAARDALTICPPSLQRIKVTV